MKRLLFLIFIWFSAQEAFATHNRAGEITYRWLGGTTYEATITTYTKESVTADRCTLELFWGDGTSSILGRSNGSSGTCDTNRMGVFLGNDIQVNKYVGRHTYSTASGAKGYILHFEDPNRNAGIKNIVQSITVPFYVQSEIFIAPSLGGNSSPILLNPPIDDGCVDQLFEHNPSAFDIDGDSLAYRLVLCRTLDGKEIQTTYDPQYVKDSIKIDPVTGDLYWDLPRAQGQYNFAIQIDEYRRTGNGNYFRIGYVVRDLQIDILQCNNRPPVIQPVGPFCVEAGQNLSFSVSATDPDNDFITLTAVGGALAAPNPALFSGNTPPIRFEPVPRLENFTWNTTCRNVRKQPYFVTFEARDTVDKDVETPLVDIFTAEIRVVAPAPRNPLAESQDDFIALRWDESICKEAIGYRLYRREDSYGFVPAQCETGVPAYTGYKLIADIEGIANTTYDDSNNLKRGVRYCYMVIAYFEDGSESYASVEFCTALPLSLPLMTNASVLTTDNLNGKIDVKWTPPPVLDTVNFPPPYSYVLYRATGLDGSDYQEIGVFNGLLDTAYTDSLLNTRDTSYRYTVAFVYSPNNDTAGRADPGSSLYLEPTPLDEGVLLDFTHNTPWFNFLYEVYREDSPGSGNFLLLDSAFTDSYQDTGLVNGDTYCYKVLAYGRYTASDSLPMPLLNFSQEICAVPIDTTAPCAPLLTASYNCQEDSLYLQWSNPVDPNCKNDIVEYRLYYKSNPEDNFPDQPIKTFSGLENSYLIRRSNDGPPVSGCYAITAVDDADQDAGGTSNESKFSRVVCAEACPLIEFPNVFTPNMDGTNDFFTAITFKDIRELRISVYNRWGTRVYQTSDGSQFLNQGWDGRDSNTGADCSEGVYYYICRYTPLSIDGSSELEATGFVHLFRNNN
ncbi:MAG: gliding motility-associated C-terminal domain-containing protein [Owenweeksia sp.]